MQYLQNCSRTIQEHRLAIADERVASSEAAREKLSEDLEDLRSERDVARREQRSLHRLLEESGEEHKRDYAELERLHGKISQLEHGHTLSTQQMAVYEDEIRELQAKLVRSLRRSVCIGFSGFNFRSCGIAAKLNVLIRMYFVRLFPA